MAGGKRKDITPVFVPEWSRADTIAVELHSYDQSQNSGITDGRRGQEEVDGEDVVDESDLYEENTTYGGRHEHLLKSGPLGRCDDPYCTTCPAYFDYSRSLSEVHGRKQRRSSFLGGARSACSRFFNWSKNVPGIYNPHTKVVQRWNQVFAVSCLIAVFVDPLFFFILSVKQDSFCIVFDKKFATLVTILRSITDGLYFLHMLLQFRLAYFAQASRTSRTGDLVDDPKTIALHYLKGWFMIDFIAVLPIPQILLWTVVKQYQYSRKAGGANYVKNLLRVVVLLQYVPRMVRILPLLVGRSSQSGFIFETAWANFTINLFIYLLAGHVVGSCWYLFGLQRVNQCLRDTCKSEAISLNCSKAYLDCGSGHDIGGLMQRDPIRMNWVQNSNASRNCIVSEPTFEYGIYGVAVPVTMESNPAQKYIFSLLWGFLQISTLGGNLEPSLFLGEVLFTMGVIGLGLLLFALLIGNMQNFLQSLGRRQLEMQLRRYDVEAWMKRRHLPADLQSRVRQAVRLKWASTRGVNEEELLERLPEDLQKEIRRFLCFELVKKVRIFTVMDDQVLDAICERLQQILYIEGSELFRMDAPLHRMVFIVRGTLESVGKDGSKHILLSGDFSGEELLIWCLEQTVQASGKTRSNLMRSIGHRAISSRTVRCLSSVEAFSLEEKDLQYVTNHYTRLMRNPRVQGAIRYESPYFRSLAAQRIQAAWRSYKRKKLALTDGGKRIFPINSLDLIRF